MWNTTRVTEKLGITYPIIQGPFGGGLSSIPLLATVSNAGGLGSFGAHHLSASEIENLVTDIRIQTQKPFAINLWIKDHDGDGLAPMRETFERAYSVLKPYFDELGLDKPAYPESFGYTFDEQIEAILKTKPPVFSFVYGIPTPEILLECNKNGIITIGTAITVDEALALDDAGVDMVVATGFEAGGHRVAFLREAEDSLIGTMSLIPQSVDRIKAPIIAAGGIADTRGIKAAFALGAEAVQIGTAFLACEESYASPLHKKKLFSPDARYTALTRAFTGRLARGIVNRIMTEMQPHASDFAPYPAQSWFTGQVKRACIEQNRDDLMSLWCGQSAPLLQHQRASELMQALIKGFSSESVRA